MENIFVGILFIALGIAAQFPYLRAAKKRWGVNLDFVQIFMYGVKTSSFSFKEQVYEFSLRMLKFCGLIAIIIGGFGLFNPL